MNIKEVCERTGMSADTIRYYEKISLLPKVARTNSGMRNFSEHDIAVLEFISCFKKAGMPLNILKQYIHLVGEGEKTIAERLSLLKEVKVDLLQHLAELQEALTVLDKKLDQYETLLYPLEEQLFTQE